AGSPPRIGSRAGLGRLGEALRQAQGRFAGDAGTSLVSGWKWLVAMKAVQPVHASRALTAVQGRLAGIAEWVGCRRPGGMSRGRRALRCGDGSRFVDSMSTESSRSGCCEVEWTMWGSVGWCWWFVGRSE
ncbi:MAG: hypothetical protein OXQ32_01350, partial [bacterium]|nr:hypothetical protein [bacterium]